MTPRFLFCRKKERNSVRITFLLAQEEGFEPPCLLGKRFSRRLTYLDFNGKYQTLTELKRG